MSPTPRADDRACPQCRTALPTRRALRRHEAMDHRPAPDGAWLTARLVGAAEHERRPKVVTEPAGGVRLADAPSGPAHPVQTRSAPGWPLVVAIVLGSVLVGPLVAAGLWLCALTVALWWRYDHLGRERRGPGSAPDREPG